MKTISRSSYFNAPSEQVFRALDDLGVTGGHMTQSSMMMMGTKLDLQYLTDHHTGLNTRYRWTGKMMGMSMDFTVIVSKWIPGFEKVWETVGESKLIIYSWYRMALTLQPGKNSTKASLAITYERPKGFWNILLSILFADMYCIWCLRKMLTDAQKTLNEKLSTSTPAS